MPFALNPYFRGLPSRVVNRTFVTIMHAVRGIVRVLTAILD